MGKRLYNFDCAKCGQPLFVWDGKQTIPVVRRCPACFHFMRFDPSILRVSEIEAVQRTTSSGARFY